MPQNNYDTLIQRITGSYDPNDKIVTPIPNAQNVVALTEQPFEYTIRFQNTGNDTAFTVVITDTLDKDFDISTFNLLAAPGPFPINCGLTRPPVHVSTSARTAPALCL